MNMGVFLNKCIEYWRWFALIYTIALPVTIIVLSIFTYAIEIMKSLMPLVLILFFVWAFSVIEFVIIMCEYRIWD